MPVFLEVRSGSQTGHKIRLNPGQPVRIGRTTKADVAFTDDPHMSGVHFTAEAVENGCRFTDLNSSNGSWLNGQRISTVVLANGDTVIAGETRFVVTIEPGQEVTVIATTPLAGATTHERLLTLLRGDFQPLYAILDAARDIRILALLLHYKEDCQSLYEGEQGARLAQVAPYLVRLQKESPLLGALAKEGWGKSWGVYLTSASPFQDLRRHLRHFLQVQLPDGKQVYFRFYDPRVLRVFLPTCTPEDANQFFGPIQNYLVEDENPGKLMRFVSRGGGIEKTIIAVDPNAKIEPTEPELETEILRENPLINGTE